MIVKETEKAQNFKQAFFDLGNQYYIAGRFSTIAGLLPVFGNQFHHAIEMFLKGCLYQKIDLAELKSKKYGHNLITIWDKFKKEFPEQELRRFDATITLLNECESIRYPDKIINKRICRSDNLRKADDTPDLAPAAHAEELSGISLEAVDDLVREIYLRAGCDSLAFAEKSDHAQIYWEKDNRFLPTIAAA